jgi:hypothetical protein
MTPAGQSVAQGICSYGQSPAFQCQHVRDTQLNIDYANYSECLEYASYSDGTPIPDEQAVCTTAWQLTPGPRERAYLACLERNQCSY